MFCKTYAIVSLQIIFINYYKSILILWKKMYRVFLKDLGNVLPQIPAAKIYVYFSSKVDNFVPKCQIITNLRLPNEFFSTQNKIFIWKIFIGAFILYITHRPNMNIVKALKTLRLSLSLTNFCKRFLEFDAKFWI